MSTLILDGKKIANDVLQSVQAEGDELAKKTGRAISLVIISVGEREDSKKYINSKLKKAQSLGFSARNVCLNENTTQIELENTIQALSIDNEVDGIILQLPIALDSNRAIEKIDPKKDIDGLHPKNQVALISRKDGLFPCTPLGIIHLIKEARSILVNSSDLSALNVVVVGRSELVGRPVAQMLINENCTVTVCHSKTNNLNLHTKSADILVSATGFAGLVSEVKEGAILIDVGLNYDSKVVRGDIDFNAVLPICAAITPVPGGVGPMTVAMLMKNLVKAKSLQLAYAHNPLK